MINEVFERINRVIKPLYEERDRQQMAAAMRIYGDRPAPEWASDDLFKGGYRMVMNPLTGGYAEGLDREAEYLFLRLDWAVPAKFKLADQPEWFNIAGLWWKAL